MHFGIYIAKFKKEYLDVDKFEGIEKAYVIGEFNIDAEEYKDCISFKEKAVKRLSKEAQLNPDKIGFRSKGVSLEEAVEDYEVFQIDDNKNHVDDRIREKLEQYCIGKNIKGTEFFIPTITYDSAKYILTKISEITNGNIDVNRKDSWSFYDFQRQIIEQACNKLSQKNELLLYLFCRVGKSAISLQIAQNISKSHRILILTSFPNSRSSFEKYTRFHTNMYGWKFATKEDLNEVEPKDKVVVFLSTAALRVKEYTDSAGEENIEEEEIYKRIKQLKNIGQFDQLIIDETHNGISSESTNSLVEYCKKEIGVEKIIHCSATPFNDFKSSRFSKDDCIQVDLLTILNNNWINFPILNMISLPFMEEERSLVDLLLKTKGNHKLLYFSDKTRDCKNFVKKYKRAFCEKGTIIEYVDDLKGEGTTERKVQDFEKHNDKTIVVTCDKLHTGVTLPLCDSVILNRDLKSAERLVQVMSRCLTPDKSKNEVYFYTVGSDNLYTAVNEIRRNYNNSQEDPTCSVFEKMCNQNKINIRKAEYVLGEDLKIYSPNFKDVLEHLAEWTCNLENITRTLNLDGLEHLTEQDIIKDLNLYSSSGISKICDILNLFKQEGNRKIKDIKNKDLQDLVEKLKKNIETEGSKIEYKSIVKDITVQEIVVTWYGMILKSLNTWLLCKNISVFEDILNYVFSIKNFNETEKDIFSIVTKNNEKFLKEFIIEHNRIYHNFHNTSLTEKVKMYNKLKKCLGPDFGNTKNIGKGYPEKLAKDLIDMVQNPFQIVAVYDDIYLEMTQYLLSVYNLNESNIYFICSNDKVKELMVKAYCIKPSKVLTINKSYNIQNMTTKKFDLIIMNPPFGAQGGNLAKKIIDNCKVCCKEMVVFAPIRSSKNQINFIKKVKYVSNLNKYFDSQTCPCMSINYITQNPVYVYKSLMEARLTTVQKDFKKAIDTYNQLNTSFCKNVHGYCNLNRKEKLKEIDENLLFVVTNWCPNDKVHSKNSAEDVQHNLLHKPINWRDRSTIYTIEFDSIAKIQNFTNWWYKQPGNSSVAKKTLIWFMLNILYEAYNGDPSIFKYLEVFPNLDWSRPWTDEEIIQELKDKAGLPQDWKLEEEK